jgi:hypothetical protein
MKLSLLTVWKEDTQKVADAKEHVTAILIVGECRFGDGL